MTAVDAARIAAFRDLLDGEVELVAGDEIELRRTPRGCSFGIDRDLGADHADLEIGIELLQRLDGLHVGRKRRRRGVQHESSQCCASGATSAKPSRCGGASISLEPSTKRGRLGQPGRIPERMHLTTHLVARAGAAIEAVVTTELAGRAYAFGPSLRFAPACRQSEARSDCLAS